MKKIIIIIIVVVLVIGGAFFIVNMGKSKGKNNKELLELVDKYAGYKSTMEYKKDSGLVIEDVKDTNRAVKKVTDGSIEMEISYVSGSEKNMKMTDNNNKHEVTDLELEGTTGYISFDPDDNEGKLVISIDNDYENNPQGMVCFKITLEDNENQKGTTVKTYLESEKFTEMVKSYKFEMTDKAIKEGVLCFDYSFGINPKSVDGYTLTYSTLNISQAQAILKDKDEKAALTVAVQPIETDDSLETFVDSKKTSSIYTGEVVDKKVGNYNIKFLPYKSASSSSTVRNYGYTEKNGKIYLVDESIIEKDFGEEKANDFVANVLDSIFEVKE